MERPPEEVERLRKVAIRGAALAAAGLALRYHKPLGEKIKSAEIWEKTETLVMDLIESAREKSIRLTAKPVWGPDSKIIDVEDVQLINDEGGEEQLRRLEEAFDNDDESVNNPLQTGEESL